MLILRTPDTLGQKEAALRLVPATQVTAGQAWHELRKRVTHVGMLNKVTAVGSSLATAGLQANQLSPGQHSPTTSYPRQPQSFESPTVTGCLRAMGWHHLDNTLRTGAFNSRLMQHFTLPSSEKRLLGGRKNRRK